MGMQRKSAFLAASIAPSLLSPVPLPSAKGPRDMPPLIYPPRHVTPGASQPASTKVWLMCRFGKEQLGMPPAMQAHRRDQGGQGAGPPCPPGVALGLTGGRGKEGPPSRPNSR
jgi:hypothetical protein